jgi:hypothetical protein
VKKKVKEPQKKVRVCYDDGSEGFLIIKCMKCGDTGMSGQEVCTCESGRKMQVLMRRIDKVFGFSDDEGEKFPEYVDGQ